MNIKKRKLEVPAPYEYVITLSSSEVHDLLDVLGCLGGADIPQRVRTIDHLWIKLFDLARDHYNYENNSLSSVCLIKKSDQPGQNEYYSDY